MSDREDIERGHGHTSPKSESYTSTFDSGNAHKRGQGHPLSKSERDSYTKHDKLDAKGLAWAAGARGVRLLRRRGNVLAIIVFGTCLFFFFGALAGIGYVAPDSPSERNPEFVVGGPVFDPSEAQKKLEAQMAVQREREAAWRKKKRPNAGSWLDRQRDAGAMRIKDIKDKEAYELDDERERRKPIPEPVPEPPVEPRIMDDAEREREAIAKAKAFIAEVDADGDEAGEEVVEIAGGSEGDGEGEVKAEVADPDAPLFPLEADVGEKREVEVESKDEPKVIIAAGLEDDAEDEVEADSDADAGLDSEVDAESDETDGARVVPPKRKRRVKKQLKPPKPEKVEAAHPEMPDRPAQARV